MKSKTLAPSSTALHRAALLLARLGVSMSTRAEMEALGRDLLETGLIDQVAIAFAEQGSPSLHTALRNLGDKCVDEVLMLPLVTPMDPGFRLWISRAVQRMRARRPDLHWPIVRMAPDPAEIQAMKQVLREMLVAAEDAEPLGEKAVFASDATLVPAQHWRVLVCQGPACNSSGAPELWVRLMQNQDRWHLRTRPPGVVGCTTSCLGPCSLAPVLQVFPGAQLYGGVNEAGVDRIVQEHLLGGVVVQDLAYAPNGRKQRLRAADCNRTAVTPKRANLPGSHCQARPLEV